MPLCGIDLLSPPATLKHILLWVAPCRGGMVYNTKLKTYPTLAGPKRKKKKHSLNIATLYLDVWLCHIP
jgi:hypothetical protein